MNADDLTMERDRWGGLTKADELVDVFAGLEEALRARDGLAAGERIGA